VVREITDLQGQRSEAWPPDPLALVRFLRGGEFRLGSADALHAVALLERLSAIGRAPRTPEEAARWLAPVLCTSARQQAILPERLRAFAAESGPTYQEVDPNPPPILDLSLPKSRPPPAWWRYPAIGFLALVLIFLVALYLLTNGQPWPSVFTNTWQSIRNTSVTDQAQRLFVALPIPLALVPPLTWLLWGSPAPPTPTGA
jgi:hypothetical protein